MYCYKCGKKLIEGANFCHNCGADQKLIDQLVDLKSDEKNNDIQTSYPSENETKIFQLGGQSEEEDLSSYLSQVDNRVKENVEKYETKDSLKKIELNDLSEEVNTNEVPSKKKRSFKDIWNDFINEEDNPYSVFGGLSEENKSEEYSKESSSTLDEKKDTKNESSFITTNEYKGLANELNKISSQKSDEKIVAKDDSFVKSDFQNTEDKKKFTFPFFQKKKETLSSNVKKVSEEDQFIAELKMQEALKEEPEPETNNKDISKKKKAFSFITKNSKSKHSNEVEEDTSSTNKVKSKEEENLNRKIQKNSKHIFTTFSNNYDSIMILIRRNFNLFLPLIFILGLIFTVSPIFIIQKSIGLAEIIFSVFKILLSLFTFYYANYIARRNTLNIDLNPALNIDTIIHWSFTNFILFIVFFFYPKDVVMGHDLLGALTPHFITSIFLYFFAAILSISSIAKKLQDEQYLEYLGWFFIVFILLELFSKLFWVIITFLSSTVL